MYKKKGMLKRNRGRTDGMKDRKKGTMNLKTNGTRERKIE